MKSILWGTLLFGAGLGSGLLLTAQPTATQAQATAPAQLAAPQTASVPATNGYLLQREAEVKQSGTGPHNGPGRSTGYSFFDKVESFKYVIRKRVLHPGSAIGYHLQKENEVYYILSGTGTMQMNGKEFPVKAGDAILTLPGSSHGLIQLGNEDLVLLISYEKK